MSAPPFRLESLQSSIHRTVEIVEGLDLGELGLGWKAPYPRGWCSVMTYTLLFVFDRLGHGKWQIVNGQSNGGSLHDWLEYMQDGEVTYSVDVTQHQFEFLGDAPFVGAGECPARSVFTIGVTSASVERMPESWAKRDSLVVCAAVLAAWE